MSDPGHEWTPHERDGWTVCSRCGMVRNYDSETSCRGSLPKIRQRSIEDCGQDGVCALSPGCNRHWEERNRELVRENAVLRENSDHLSAENASLSRQVESMAMRIESLAAELAKPEDVRLREVTDVLDGRAVMFDSLADRVDWILRELDEWIERAGAAERERDRLRKLFDDAGQGEHNVLALIDHYQLASMEADDRISAARAELEKNGCDCECWSSRWHGPEDHDDGCERCLACRIEKVLR